MTFIAQPTGQFRATARIQNFGMPIKHTELGWISNYCPKGSSESNSHMMEPWSASGKAADGSSLAVPASIS